MLRPNQCKILTARVINNLEVNRLRRSSKGKLLGLKGVAGRELGVAVGWASGAVRWLVVRRRYV